MLIDQFGRKLTKLRISITDRCNLKCIYCMPSQKPKWIKREQLLSYEEIERISIIFIQLGIKQIRLTGGEPLLREDVSLLIKKLKNIKGLEKISLTTNAVLLDYQLGKLINAGLDAINISLDTLSSEKFRCIARADSLDRIIRNIKLAVGSGLEVKLNCVLIKGLNDNEIEDMLNFSKDLGITLRFIEFMPLDGNRNWSMEKVITKNEILERINGNGRIKQIEMVEIQPAQIFYFGDCKFGIIPSVSEPFCKNCNRLRLTSDGNLRTCLFSDKETSLKKLIRDGEDDDKIKDVISKVVYNKEEGFIALRGKINLARTMHLIGG